MTGAEANTSVSRRGFLRAAAGGAAIVGVSGAAASPAAAQETATVEVGPNNEFVYTPGTEEPLVIAPGTTVTFVWESDTHNIVVDSQPEDANWEGYEDIENTGFEYEYTFEVEGEYTYYCEPHLSLGMEGTIRVEEGAAASGDESGGEPAGPQIPDSAKTMGVATGGSMITVLGLIYFFMKYGGDYGDVQ